MNIKALRELIDCGEAKGTPEPHFDSFDNDIKRYSEPLRKVPRYFFNNPREYTSVPWRWKVLRSYISESFLLNSPPASSKTPLLIDVGVCMGDWTLRELGMYITDPSTRILGFEPNPVNFNHTKKRHASLSSIPTPSKCSPVISIPSSQCLVYPYALDNKSSHQYLMVSKHSENNIGEGNACLVASEEDLRYRHRKSVARVEVKRLDEILESYGGTSDITINYMKIDAEGHDSLVIRGMGEYLSCVEFLQFELNAMIRDIPDASSTPFKDIVSHLDSKDFNCYLLGVRSCIKLNGESWDDVYNTLECINGALDIFVAAKSNTVIEQITNKSGHWLPLEEIF